MRGWLAGNGCYWCGKTKVIVCIALFVHENVVIHRHHQTKGVWGRGGEYTGEGGHVNMKVDVKPLGPWLGHTAVRTPKYGRTSL